MHKVIVYHTISAPDAPLPSNIDVSPERFESHVRWLSARRDQVRSLKELVSLSPSANVLAITFDDGYKDNLTVALPILEKYALPVTIFIAAGFIGRPGYLDESDVRELASHPLVTIGSHGYWHLHLSSLSRAEMHFELTESKKVLETLTGNSIDLVAYPYGDCNEDVERTSRDCGYTAGWSVWNGQNTPFCRWRVPLGRNDNLPRFIAKVSPYYFPIKRIVRPPLRAEGHLLRVEAGSQI